MEIRKGYQADAALRRSFNALAEETFGLNFENWYQNGFWGENYTPYSLILDGEVVANVSLNRTDLVAAGQRKRLYQIGTVMTAKEYRNRGFIRLLMAEVEKDIRDADGVYLFANDTVTEFYPKFGFVPGTEHICTQNLALTGEYTMAQIPMDGPAAWEKLARAMEESAFPTGCHMADNPGLIFFYASQFLADCVYYSEALDTWAIAEREAGELVLHNVFSAREVSLEAVIAAFGKVEKVSLGFTPADLSGWTVEEYQEEGSHFFVKGPFFQDFGEKKRRIPTLSHA